MKARHYVCRTEELPMGQRRIVRIGSKSIGVFNVGGEFFALLNVCPHQFAPLCEGRICGYNAPSRVGEFLHEREGEILRCPWHGWEFDIKTGRSIFNPHRVRTARYEVRVEPAPGTAPRAHEEDPGIETFPVRLEGGGVFVEV
jgi:3-phenylpropionate/trans-cinnamate dioxygenase ferredoxin subunit